ncbi:hypothetical protein CHU93_15935 [Sandarakinorhabdus cyanobacteriorum]|uniref:Cytochrome c oxidase subunit IV bacterial aa3 type domain-containing protein n=1 Tax=Sandarakinorhabdus cyanobacteriorum TaxID=1981098 RepID=A0A255Y565_9SPHN|nr:aa3-type cytochrome c oxidase subunit IV [Sandarakinorhabdus cyanobacteriorum]OYQ24328.1 hypothetical protein CHU93_15935 [Sandarakinorhabdus cyanobacteriorum]
MASNNHPMDGHKATYSGFTAATKWGTTFVVTVVVALYVFLV